MHGIAPHNVEDLGILFTVRSKRFSALGDIPEQIFDLDKSVTYQTSAFKCTDRYLRTTTTSSGFRIGTLSRLSWNQPSISIVGTPCAARVCSLGCHGEMRDVTDASQCFTTETVGTNRCEIFECLELRSGEPLTEYWQVISLATAQIISARTGFMGPDSVR